MGNIHIIPTDKISRLHLIEDVLMFTNKYKNSVCDSEVNIYITNDEKIKEGDWYLNIEEKNGIKNPFYGKLYKANYSIKSVNTDYRHNLKKIILTTDQELIKDGVQAIDDEFLEWFVKNPSCKFVKIADDVECLPMPNIHIHKHIYKIIIPQEKPKQMNKQTAVEQFLNAIKDQIPLSKEHLEMIESYAKQAKEMEKEQMISFYVEGCKNSYGIDAHEEYDRIDGENYYNETYKKKNETPNCS